MLHPALRAAEGADFHALGEPVSDGGPFGPQGHGRLCRCRSGGRETGATGRAFKAIVHIGIGGSDLGPRLVWDALRPLDPAIDLRFVANIDPRDMAEALTGLDPETTLVVVVSKTFTTQETLANAEAAKAWLAAGLPKQGGTSISSASPPRRTRPRPSAAPATFAFRDWVGGRYSLWSAVSLSCVIALGRGGVRRPAGRRRRHGRPFRLGAAGEERAGPAGPGPGLERRRPEPARAHGRALRPCAASPALLPAAAGDGVERQAGASRRLARHPPDLPVVFGEPGTNGQHAFFQQIHQGPQVVPAEFVIVAQHACRRAGEPAVVQRPGPGPGPDARQDDGRGPAELMASGAAEAEADRLAPHKTFPGNRPSTAIVMERLTPETLGALLALYEHKTFVEGVIWDINRFDQWGVELGKVLAKAILKDVAAGGPSAELDPSTAALLTRLT